MTQFEDLLRESLLNAPTPATTTLDPQADLERRLGRARKRRAGFAVATVATVAAVVAATVMPLTLVGSGSHAPSPGSPVSFADVPEVVPQIWNGTGETSVGNAGHELVYAPAAGGGYVWTLGVRLAHRRVQQLVQERDPASGRVIKAWPLAAVGISYGDGRLWAWSGGHHRKDRVVATVTTIDPANGRVRTRVVQQPTTEAITGLVFLHDGVWAYTADGGQVFAITAPLDHVHGSSTNDFVRHDVAAFPAGTNAFYVAGLNGATRLVASSTGSAEPDGNGAKTPFVSRGRPLALNALGFWTVVGNSVVRTDRSGKPVGSSLGLPPTMAGGARRPERALSLVTDSDGGVYVALVETGRGAPPAELLYYSPAALRAVAPTPTALHEGPGAQWMVADPAGGVVFSGIHGAVARWDPAS